MRAARSVRFAPTASRVSYSRAILAQQKITQTKQYNRATTYKPYVKQPARIQYEPVLILHNSNISTDHTILTKIPFQDTHRNTK